MMLYLILLVFIIFLLIMFPYVRCAVLNLHKVLFYLPIDIYFYFKHKAYNNVPVGLLVSVIGMFGRGKTLTVVHMVLAMYMAKNNKLVWCPRRKKMVRQRIKVISNVDLKIPYEEFVSMEQIVYAKENNQHYDDEHNTLTVTLVIGDEFSTQMNCRNFKTNIDPLTLNTILTSRHCYLAIYYTTQRFQMVDALLRQVTSYCIDCHKVWRLQGLKYYDAWQLENASDPTAVQPFRKDCWFVCNKDYNAYDTIATVDNLRKIALDGGMISEEQILSLQCNSPDMGQVITPSRKYRKTQKRMYK